MKHNQHKNEMLIARATQSNESVKSAREHTSEGFSFTRRILAISSVLAIVLIPIVAGAIFPGMPVNYGWQETSGGFMFFTEPKAMMQFATGYGITILPFHTHLISAISGLYFGSSTVK